MTSLAYLVRTEIKNFLKELIHKPGKLVLYLLVAAGIAGMVVLSVFTGEAAAERGVVPMFWLRGIYFLFLIIFVVLAVQKGLTAGDAIFEMSDVNLLFVSPVNPRSILLYGLVRLAKMSFLAGFFILFQSSSLANFGIGYGGILLLFALFILTMVVLSLVSLVIYSASNGHPRRKMAVRAIAVGVFVPVAVYFAVQYFASGDITAAVQAAVSSPLLNAVPIAGWSTAATLAFLEGNTATGFAWLALLLAGGGALLAYIMLSKSHYYEDVLVATETAFERKRAAEEGDMQAAAATSGKVRVTKTGVGGRGASAFFYKHLRETFRQNRFGFFSLYTIIVFACVLGAAVFLKGEFPLVIILQTLMWMQIFMIGNGRGLRELYTHYIYLVPEPAFKKAVWSNMELVFKTLLESVLFFAVPGLVMGENVLVILGCVLTYTLFAMMLLSVNYASMRFTEANISAGLLLTIYFAAVMLIMAPGAVPALIVGFMLGGTWGTLAGLGILSVWELGMAALFFALSKNVLHNCDMPSAKPMGK